MGARDGAGRPQPLLRVPTGLLARMRWLFLCFGLFNVVGLIAQIVPQSATSPAARLAAVVLLSALGAWWVRGYRRAAFSVRGQLFEASALFLAALAIGDPYKAFGLLYTGTNFRSLYGSRAAVTSYILLHLGAGLAAVLVGPAMGLERDLEGFLQQVPGVPILGILAYIIAKTVISHERGLAREQVLLRAGTELGAYGDRTSIYRTGVEAARELLADLPGAGAAIGTDTATGHEVVAASGNGIPADLVGTRFDPGEATPELLEALAHGQTVFAPESLSQRRALPPALSPSGGRSMLVPLRTGQALHGALVVTGEAPIPAEVRGAVETLGVQLGLALENASLTDDLRHRAFTDSLTGLANRASLLERVEQETERAQRGDPERRGFAVLLVDLDGFKSVNDSHGHAVGDLLLISAAQRLRHSIRPGDTAARLGGDEFAAVLTDLGTEDDAAAVAERVVAALREPFAFEGILLTASGSVGLAHWAGHANADAVLRDADSAMYAAKAAGKSRLSVFGGSHDGAAPAALGTSGARAASA